MADDSSATDTLYIEVEPGSDLASLHLELKRFGDILKFSRRHKSHTVGKVVFFDVRAAAEVLQTLGPARCEVAAPTSDRTARLTGDIQLNAEEVNGVSSILPSADNDDGTFALVFFDSRDAARCRERVSKSNQSKLSTSATSTSGYAEQSPCSIVPPPGLEALTATVTAAAPAATALTAEHQPPPGTVAHARLLKEAKEDFLKTSTAPSRKVEQLPTTTDPRARCMPGECVHPAAQAMWLPANEDMQGSEWAPWDRYGGSVPYPAWQPLQEPMGRTSCSGLPFPVHQVSITGLPNEVCTGPMMTAMLQQAIFGANVVGFSAKKGIASGQALISLSTWQAAERCYKHFTDSRWNAAFGSVRAWIVPQFTEHVMAPAPAFELPQWASSARKAVRVRDGSDASTEIGGDSEAGDSEGIAGAAFES